MRHGSPTLEGLRVVFRHPIFGLAEVAWRWAFGGAALGLLTFTILEYLNTLPVTSGDLLFLRSRQGWLMFRAMRHIATGSAGRLVGAAVLLGLGVAYLWVMAASLGRNATAKVLLEHFRRRENARPERSSATAPLIGIHVFRVAVFVALLLGLWGAGVVAGLVSRETHPRPGLSLVAFVLLAGAVVTVAGTWNWILSIAPIFAIRDGLDTFGSTSRAIEFVYRRFGAVAGTSGAFSLIHLAAFTMTSSVVLLPLNFARIIPGWLVLTSIVVLTLAYFALVDFIYLGRLAAYLWILESVEPPAVRYAPEIAPQPPASDDDILSDVPGLAPPPEPA